MTAGKDGIRVLHIVGDSRYGGIARIILGVGRTAQEDGWQVDVLTTDPVVQNVFRRQSFGIVDVDVIRREIRPVWDLRGLFRLRRYLRSHRYEIVHTHTSKGGFVGRLAAWLAGVPVVVHTAHGFAIHEQSPAWARVLYTLLERMAARWCDRIVSVSEFHQQWAVQLRMCAPHQIQAIPNGITPAARKIDCEPGVLRRELGIADDDLFILSLARLAPDKGIADLVDAIAALPRTERYRVMVAGDGPSRDQLEERARERGVSDRVTFLGFRDDVGDLLAAADLVTLPSLREGLSISLLEAMAAGKPIIASSIGSHRELAAQAEMATLVPPANPAALAAAIQQFAHDAERRTRLASNARSLFEARYTEARMLKDYRRLYFHLLQQNGLMRPTAVSGGESRVRPATLRDLPAIVEIHRRAFGNFFLSQMGGKFLYAYYELLYHYQGGIMLVSEKHGSVSGFVCGFADPAAFYRSMWTRRRAFALPALLALLRRPSLIGKVIRGARRIQSSAAYAPRRCCELCSIAVSPEASGNGMGRQLLRAFLDEAWSKQTEYVYLTTDAEANEGANAVYREMGFRHSRCFLQRKGRWMNEYVFHRASADRLVETLS